GITVNAVAPGFIDTEMVRSVPEDILGQLAARTPLGRLGRADEVANAYLFLASEEASFITGAVLNVDGGLTL
ncbi:MAG: SDR family oxidoreductase, partial [Bacteroidetes bacterium]